MHKAKLKVYYIRLATDLKNSYQVFFFSNFFFDKPCLIVVLKQRLKENFQVKILKKSFDNFPFSLKSAPGPSKSDCTVRSWNLETLQKIASALQQRITSQTKVTKVKRAEGGTFEINCLSLPVFEIVESA